MSTFGSVPIDPIRNAEDFGYILFQAQRDLERVRQQLDALPLESGLRGVSSGPNAGSSSASLEGSLINTSAGDAVRDVYSSLSDLIARTESDLRIKAEVVLRAVENARAPLVLPNIARPNSAGTPSSSSSGTAMQSPFIRTGPVASMANSYPTPLSPSPSSAVTSSSTSLSSSGVQGRYLRRAVKDRMSEISVMKQLAHPETKQGRDFLSQLYGLHPSASSTSTSTPTGVSGSGIVTRSTSSSSSSKHPRPLIFNNNNGPSRHKQAGKPGLLRSGTLNRAGVTVVGSSPSSSSSTSSSSSSSSAGTVSVAVAASTLANQGVANLIERGAVPSFADVTAAFALQNPLQGFSAPLHPSSSKFSLPAVPATASHLDGLSRLRLDAGHMLFQQDLDNAARIDGLSLGSGSARGNGGSENADSGIGGGAYVSTITSNVTTGETGLLTHYRELPELGNNGTAAGAGGSNDADNLDAPPLLGYHPHNVPLADGKKILPQSLFMAPIPPPTVTDSQPVPVITSTSSSSSSSSTSSSSTSSSSSFSSSSSSSASVGHRAFRLPPSQRALSMTTFLASQAGAPTYPHAAQTLLEEEAAKAQAQAQHYQQQQQQREPSQSKPPQTHVPLIEERIKSYEALLNAYSLHQVILRDGRIMRYSPEFAAFKQKFSPMWGTIEAVLSMIEAFAARHSINMAHISGEKVCHCALAYSLTLYNCDDFIK